MVTALNSETSKAILQILHHLCCRNIYPHSSEYSTEQFLQGCLLFYKMSDHVKQKSMVHYIKDTNYNTVTTSYKP